jgi:CMP-N-acetylneuraminic acid synthetase
MAWTIEQAKASKLITRFVVSTEDEEMKQVAREYGAEVIDRPPELAQDETSTWEVIEHALNYLHPYKPDAIVLLQVCCPIRPIGFIDKCIEQFFKDKPDSLVTGYECKEVPWGVPIERRQDIKGFFASDGSIYIVTPKTVFNGDLMGKKYSYVHTPKQQRVDIDEEFDFWMAEKIMKERM